MVTHVLASGESNDACAPRQIPVRLHQGRIRHFGRRARILERGRGELAVPSLQVSALLFNFCL